MNRIKRKLSHLAHGRHQEPLRKDSIVVDGLMKSCQKLVPTLSTLRSCGYTSAPVCQNFQLVWLNTGVDESENYINPDMIGILRHIANNVHIFVDVKECVNFIEDIEDEYIILVLSGKLMQPSMPAVHNLSQITSILIFCENTLKHEVWVHQWSKVRGVYMDTDTLCDALQQVTQECDRNSISMSFIKINESPPYFCLKELDQSFVNSQIIKEIILNNTYKEQDIETFIAYYRTQIVGNGAELKNIEKFQREYHDYGPIWWYTSGSFLSSILSRAMRLMEMEKIIKMSFFIRHLHQQISQLHVNLRESDVFIAYHSLGMSQTTFDQLMKTRDGLISFNNFLFATKKRDISMNYAHQIIKNSNLIGIVFAMKIDPSITSTPFANIHDKWCYPTEGEILFSLPSVFRIDRITQIDDHIDRLWLVELTLCTQNDIQLSTLIKCITEKTASYGKGWCRLSKLLLEQDQMTEAECVCQFALTQTLNDKEKAILNYQLGSIKLHENEYRQAISYYEASLRDHQKDQSSNYMDIAASYNEIGLAYEKINENSKALSSFEKAHEIYREILPANDLSLVKYVNNIARIYCQMGQNLQSLSYYQEALEAYQKFLPSDSPDLATAHINIGSVYEKMNEYEKAISFFIKALAIYEKAASKDRSAMAECYYNIGLVYDKIHEYSIALTYYEEALKIHETIRPIDLPKLAATYQNIATIYFHRADYLHARCFYEKAYDIYVKILPDNHPDLAASYMCQGSVFEQIGRYKDALRFYDQAYNIYQNVLPIDHLALAHTLNSISSIYAKTGEYFMANQYSGHALDIEQKSLIGNRSSVHSGSRSGSER